MSKIRLEMQIGENIENVDKAEIVMVFPDGSERVIEADIVDRERGIIETFITPNIDECQVYSRLTFPRGGIRLEAKRDRDSYPLPVFDLRAEPLTDAE